MKKRILSLMLCMLLTAAMIPMEACAADPVSIEVTGVPTKLNVGDDAPTPEDISVIVGGRAAKVDYVGIEPVFSSEYDYANYQEGGKITTSGDHAIIIGIRNARAQIFGISAVTINGVAAAEFGNYANVVDSVWEDGEKMYALDVDLRDFTRREIKAMKDNGCIYVDTYLRYDGYLEFKCFIEVGEESSAPADVHDTPAADTNSFPFTDVSKDAYYYDAVGWAYSHEPQITDGTSATTFSPARNCTRAQVVTFLWRQAGCPEPESSDNPFSDVAESDWFCKPVLWAVEKGITEGTSSDKFSPVSSCKNNHILTFIWRAMGKPGETGEGSWWQDALNWAEGEGMLKGSYTGDYIIDAECPRANVVYYLWQMEN